MKRRTGIIFAAASLSAACLNPAAAETLAEQTQAMELTVNFETEEKAFTKIFVPAYDEEGNFSLLVKDPEETGPDETVDDASGQRENADIAASGAAEDADIAASGPVEDAELIRFIDGQLWLNMETASALYTGVTGDASSASLLALLGVLHPWLSVPAFELQTLDGYMLPDFKNLPPLSDELLSDLEGIGEAVHMEQTEETVSYAFDRDLLLAAADRLEGVLAGHRTELEEYRKKLDFAAFLEGVDWNATFAGYLEAAAKGCMTVTEKTQEEAEAEIEQAAAALKDQAAVLAGKLPSPEEPIPDLSALLGAVLENCVLHGQLDVPVPPENGETVLAMDFTRGESVLDFRAAFDGEGSSDGVLHYRDAFRNYGMSFSLRKTDALTVEEVKAPEEASSLYDVTTNIASLYYGLQAMGEKLNEEQGESAEPQG